ncbi:MAG: hypothetical protein J2P55_01460 [Rhizobiales bacterium]|nr:hypothetical protein [Hyphomicrobiales bacterium]
MSIPFLSVRPKAIKLKVVPKFPADIRNGVGTSVRKIDGNAYIDLDYADLPPSPLPPNTNNQIAIYDPLLGTYTMVPILYLGGGIYADAPLDGFTYGRNNAAWDRALSLANGGTVAGSVTFNGTATFGNTVTVNGAATFTSTVAVPTPTIAGQAANKGYVDTAVSNVAGTALPLMDGVAAVGVGTKYSREDHVHPTDTTRAPVNNPTFTGDPKAPTPTAGDNDTSISTTAFVTTAISNAASATAGTALPIMDGVAAVGVSVKWAHEDHVHPTDTSRAPVNNPVLTGNPQSVTPAVDNNSVSIATTAYVIGQAGGANPLMNGAAAPGVSTRWSRQDHVHPTDTSRAPIASPSFTGTVTIGGSFVLSGIATPAAISANQNNYNPTGLGSNVLLRLSATAPVNITGLVAQTSGSLVALTNTGASAITLTNLDAGSSAANQFNIGANVSLTTGQTALLIYDGTTSQWRNFAGSGSGGGSGGASVYVQDTAPTGATPGALWWCSANGQLYILYSDGTSTQWVYASNSGGAVSAAPTKNYVINGAMMVSQEYGSTAASATGAFPVDMFSIGFVSGTFTSQQVALATPSGSPNRLRTTINTMGAVGANDFLLFTQNIEGFRCADLAWGSSAAKTVTVQFGFKGPAGNYAFAIRSGASRSYIAPFTIAAGEANIDVVRSLTIPGDITGTWPKDNSAAMTLSWCCFAGTTYQATPNTWSAGNFVWPTGVTGVSAAGSVFELFDVGLYQGGVAPVFQVPDFSAELQVCQRYWCKSYNYGDRLGATAVYGFEAIVASNSVNGELKFVNFPVKMRAAPAVTEYSSQTGAVNKLYDASAASDTATVAVGGISERGYSIPSSGVAGISGHLYFWHFKADARI